VKWTPELAMGYHGDHVLSDQRGVRNTLKVVCICKDREVRVLAETYLHKVPESFWTMWKSFIHNVVRGTKLLFVITRGRYALVLGMPEEPVSAGLI
jgi:hypothetical protein